MNDDQELLVNIGRAVRHDLESFINTVPETTVGAPWSEKKVQLALAEMNDALVVPYWIDVKIRDTYKQVVENIGPLTACVVVADDRSGYLLVRDIQRGDYLLVHLLKGIPSSFGVRGDAVGCFLAR